MKRTVNLLACLGVFVIGVVLAQASDGTTTAAPAKPCCGDTKPVTKDTTTPDTKTAAGAKRLGPPYACLQYLLYDDGVLRLWSADEYPDLPCSTTPEEIFLWTDAEKTAPQSCESGCENLTFGIKPVNVARNKFKLKTPLDSAKKFFDDLGQATTPDAWGGQKWDPKEGLKDFGEMQFDYVVVEGSAPNELIPVKLSAGIADFDKVIFTIKTKGFKFPPAPKVRRRVITVGFEVAALPEGLDPKTLTTLTAYSWKHHPEDPAVVDDNTAFTVDWQGVTYYVTTQRPVKAIQQRLTKPLVK